MIPDDPSQTNMRDFEARLTPFGNIIRMDLDRTLYEVSGNTNTSDSYAVSPSYLLTLGRRGLWSYKDDNGNGSCFFCWHPNNDGQIIILPALGSNPQKVIENLVRILPRPEKGFILARVTQEQDQTFEDGKKAGLFIPQPEKLLDWEYPCHILDVREFADLAPPGHGSMRRNVKPFTQPKDGEKPATLKPLIDRRSFTNILAAWGRPGEQGNGDAYDLMTYFDHMLDLAERSIQSQPSFIPDVMSDRRPLRLAALEFGGKKIGYIFWDEDRKSGTANYFGAVHDYSHHNIVATMLHLLCKQLAERGIHSVNLGGSETDRLNDFKLRLHPRHSYSLQTYGIDPDKVPLYSPKPPIAPAHPAYTVSGGTNTPSISG